MSVNGLVVMTPTSIASTGTGNSSSIGANGKVTFSSCVTLSLNGVFTSSYDNYMVVIRNQHSASTLDMGFRLRDSTPADASGSNYTRQYLFADSTSVSAGRGSLVTAAVIGQTSSTQRSGTTAYVFGPYLAQPTAVRCVDGDGASGATILDYASTHSLSTSYVGFTILPLSSGSISGAVTVYGFNQ